MYELVWGVNCGRSSEWSALLLTINTLSTRALLPDRTVLVWPCLASYALLAECYAQLSGWWMRTASAHSLYLFPSTFRQFDSLPQIRQVSD